MKLLVSPIAEGRTAEIYAWDDKHVLKLYRGWCPPDWVDYEARIARAVYDSGIPSPEPSQIIEVDSRRGLVYERLIGISMLQDMNARPWMLWKHARSLAELHAVIHRKSITGLPLYKNRLRNDIRQVPQLTDDLRKKALILLDQLPDRQNMCHGDFHPGNILLTKKGPVAIDWMTACSGSPWGDVARTSLILGISAKSAGRQVHPVIRTAIRFYHRTYLNRYYAINSDVEDEMHKWLPLIAAARLSENIIPEREALIKMVKEGFTE